MTRDSIEVSGIHLVRIGEYVLVKAEIDGRWVTLINEHVGGSFSHIIGSSGIRAVNEAVKEIEHMISLPQQEF